jgi:hypothetical protein
MASLDEIIEAYLSKDKNKITGNTLIVANHLAQMKLFGVRKGVELYPDQDDDYDTRKKFIANIWKQNQLDLYLERIWDLTLCKGQVLLYLRPTKDGTYKIYFYNKDSFRAYYNADGDLSEVVIRYSYKVRSTYDTAQNLRWIKLRITSEIVEQSETEQQPAFDGEFYDSPNTKQYENTLKFIPCVVVKNNPTAPGEDGVSEFEALRSQIENHDKQVGAINANLEFFGNPSLVSTRSPNELMEAAMEPDTPALSRSRTMTSAGGWYGGGQGSTRKADPFTYRAGHGGIRVKKIVGNVGPEERFGYIAPDPISPDHAQHVRETRESTHYALGGIDELGINTNATAYEVKSIYGRIATTSMKKCRAIYEHGLCKLFEMAIAAEEDLFRLSLAFALKRKPEQISDGMIQQLLEKGKIPPNVFGMPPLGSRTIKWRHTGPVFEDSPRDLQLKSIVCRNLQELGVRSLEALRTLFDDKTEKELEGMLKGGYPFRYMSSVANTTQQMLGLYQQMLNLPDQMNPNQPLAFSIPLAPLISRSIETLYKELDYDPGLDPVSPGDIPDYNTGLSNYQQYRTPVSAGVTSNPAQLLPGSTGSGNSIPPTTGIPNNPSPLAASGIFPYPITGEPLQGSIQQGGVPPEYAANLPTPGATVTNSAANYPQSQQSVLGSQLSPGSPIPPDLAIGADQPGSIWSQLFPTFTAAAKSVSKRTRKK